jgi:anti-sigma factor RsiW
MNHIDELVLQQIAEGRFSTDAAVDRHLTECAICRSSLETYRFMAMTLVQSHESLPDSYFVDRVMSRIQAWDERRAYWKEWLWVWIGGLAGLVATIIFTLMPVSGVQSEMLAEWGAAIREKGTLITEQAAALVGGHFQLLVLALVIILAFEWFDKRLIRRLHAGINK